MLVTEDEARKIFFTPENRPSRTQMKKLRRTHHLPALCFGHRVLYWSDELESHLKTMDSSKKHSQDTARHLTISLNP